MIPKSAAQICSNCGSEQSSFEWIEGLTQPLCSNCGYAQVKKGGKADTANVFDFGDLQGYKQSATSSSAKQ